VEDVRRTGCVPATEYPADKKTTEDDSDTDQEDLLHTTLVPPAG